MNRRKADRHLTSVELIQVVLKNVKSKGDKNERGRSCRYVKKHWSHYFTVAVNSTSGDISAEPVRRQKIEEHVGIDLDLRKDENRLSLTSGAVAEERQEVSSKNTIDDMADAITGGNDIGFWSANIPEKMQEFGWKLNRSSLTWWWKVIFKPWGSTTQKRQKLVTKLHHKQARNQGRREGEAPLENFSPPPWRNVLDVVKNYWT